MGRRIRFVLALCLGLVPPLGAGVAVFVISHIKVGPRAIEASVTRSRAEIDQAWRLPVAATFNREVSWQSNSSLCGPASIANVLRSLNEGARSEAEVLRGTGRCWTGVCIMGLTLDELGDVARRKTMRSVTVLRDLTPVQFKEHLRRSNDPNRRYIVNFSRKEIFGAGTGHHSPIGGYLEVDDLVFVLDVNREYQPWLVESDRLYSAMNTLDGKRKRGMLVIE